MEIDTAYLSDAGGREVNQDDGGSVENGEIGAWVIADGLGGHKGGEVASTLAVETVLNAFRANPDLDADLIESHVEDAHETILQEQGENPERSSMRTTIVALFRNGTEARWVHVGDARLYHFRGGGVQFQTKDHSVPQTMVAAGEISPEEIRFHEDRSRLLRAVGQEGEIRPELGPESASLRPGDAFLLCTDGFWEYVTETQMEVALAQSIGADEWLGRMERMLHRRAEGEHDNYSATGLIVNDTAES